MTRGLFTTAVFLALAAWAGAQGPAPLSTGDHLRLLRENHRLLGALVEHGVRLADADTALQRADAAHAAAQRLGEELRTAAGAGDADRVAEMSMHLDTLLGGALEPTIKDAREQIPSGSDEAKRLRELYDRVVRELDATRGAVPAGGAVGDSAEAKSARGRLATARDRLAGIGTDWK
jgi:hypothetical protein